MNPWQSLRGEVDGTLLPGALRGNTAGCTKMGIH
jgi:hypothetical protein